LQKEKLAKAKSELLQKKEWAKIRISFCTRKEIGLTINELLHKK